MISFFSDAENVTYRDASLAVSEGRTLPAAQAVLDSQC